jgi:voltage-gated potassium channel
VQPRLTRSALLLAAIFGAGTLGYRLIEGAGWWDREVFPLSRAGQVFTVVLLLSGLGVLLLVATEIGRSVVEGQLRAAFGRMRRSRMIERLSGHEIVCGWGRVGQAVVAELRRNRRDVVVIENRPEKVAQLQDTGVQVVEGDATSESVLRAAGAERARGLVACLNDDAHNVYTVLTARSLNPKLRIVARAGEEGAEARLQRAGADKVVNPYLHGGVRLAHLLVKPAVIDFLDFSLGPTTEAGLEVEQVPVAADSPLSEATLAEADLRRRCGVGVVAVKRNTELFPNPEADFRLRVGDTLVVLGSRTQLESFESLACASADKKEN